MRDLCQHYARSAAAIVSLYSTLHMVNVRAAVASAANCRYTFTASPFMTDKGNSVAELLSHCRGIYARVARTLDVDASMVSRVANGIRKSPEIDAALRKELMALKNLLADYD
jgi:hypothetical protein